MTPATLSAGPVQNWIQESSDTSRLRHTWGALIADKPRIQATIQDGVTAGLPLKQSLETRLAAVIETATSTCLRALDDEEDKATAKLFVQKAAQAADEAWEQTIAGLQGPSVTNPTASVLEHPSSASQDEDSEDMDFSAPRKSRLSAPQLKAQLSEEHKWLYHLDACAGSVLTPHDYITDVQERLGNSVDRIWRVPLMRLFPGPTVATRRDPAARPKPREDTTHAFTLWYAVNKLADPGVTSEPRGQAG